MRAVIQRVSHAKVTIDGSISGEIGVGFLILLAIAPTDTEKEALYLAKKCVSLRIFSDDADRMNRSLADVGGSILAVSQFTLYGDCRKGNRPNFMGAAKGEQANLLYTRFIDHCRSLGIRTETGEFGADMKVELLNDGPVTILMDTQDMIRN